MKNKLLFGAILLCVCALPVWADDITLKDLTLPKPPAYRVGLSAYPERQYVQATEDITNSEQHYAKIENTDTNIADVTYADLSIKRLSKEISQELQYEEKDMVADLSLLWQGAATQSDTINFALYKLANPDADKPDEKSIKKVLTTIASMSTLVGAGIGNPVLAGTSLIGGNVLGIMGQDTKALNYKYTRVNDADMIILIRKVEDLQQKAVDLYYDYMSAKRQLEFMNDLVADRKRKFELAQQNNAARELIVITDAYYRTALDKQRTAKSDFFSKRAALEQFVGNETFIQFESELTAREGTGSAFANKDIPMQEVDAEEYSKTINVVENYIDSGYKNVSKNKDSESNEVSTSYNYMNNSITDIALPEEGGNFYSDFPTGYAAPTTLEEFFHPELLEKPKKEKVQKLNNAKSITKKSSEKKQKLKKDKPRTVKTKSKVAKQPKIKKIKTEKQKQPKEETANETIKQTSTQNKTTSWYETWTNEAKEEKIKEKQEKKEAKKQIKSKRNKTKPKSENEKKLLTEEIQNSVNEDAITGSEPQEETVSISDFKENKKKVKKDKKTTKTKKQKKEKDLYPELHGQKPIHTYPRNSEKDLIFLHGRDKHEAKKPSEMTPEEKKELKIRNEAYSKEYRATRRARESQELLEEASLKPVTDKSSRPVRMSPTMQQGQPYLQYDDNYQEDTSNAKSTPASVKVEAPKTPVAKPASDTKILPLNTSAPSVVRPIKPASDLGLPPLDAIRVPELTKGGYSIHSAGGEY